MSRSKYDTILFWPQSSDRKEQNGYSSRSALWGGAAKTGASLFARQVLGPFSKYSVVSRGGEFGLRADEISEAPVFMRLSDLALL